MITMYWPQNREVKEDSTEESKRKLSENLLPFSENPAIPIVFLSNIHSFQFIHHSISSFLQRSSPSSTSPEYDRSAIRNSYHYFTPLNKQLSPLLSSYLELSSGRRTSSSTTLSRPVSNGEPFSYSFDDFILPSVTRTELDRISRKFPTHFLSTLEKALFEASTDTPDILSLHSSNIQYLSNTYPFFEMLCHLYFTLNPNFLPKFITLCANSPLYLKSSPLRSKNSNTWESQHLETSEETSHLRRCLLRVLRALPPITEKNVEIHFKLLFDLDMKSNAVQLLVSFGRWDQAVDALRSLFAETAIASHSTGEKEKAFAIKKQQHVEIFHVLLEDCLKKRNYQKCVDIWDYVPSSFQSMNLFRMLLLHKPQLNENGVDIVTSGEGKIGNFIKILRLLIDKQKNSEKPKE